ncbi:MAG: hypothetical protein M1818_002880 [Claussenomyces sp. TS43310]|nr:MAG: hypothetical protein M1818_002880 [Claussenomyces sp. TS43310]
MDEERAPVGIARLSKDIIYMIFEHLAAEPEEVGVDRRAWLSMASFKPPHSQSQQHFHDAKAVGNFRWTCKRYAEVGIPFQFQRLVVRFSVDGIRRLRGIAESPHLAVVVRKFTYMVPRFFLHEHASVEEYLQVTDPSGRRPRLREMSDMAKDQLNIVASKEDVRALSAAMSAFTSLQHVQLLRVQNQLHFEFLSHLQHHPEAADRFVRFEWASASVHASRTVGRALLSSNSPAARLSCQLDVPSALTLLARPGNGTAQLAARLECLSIRFEAFERGNQTAQLPAIFRQIFSASQHSMVSMHIGFPQEPVSISIEEIFLGIQMERLRVFSIDNWRLGGAEIINVVEQYSNALRGLRLRGVLLEEGSLWKDVLQELRQRMRSLVWLSLRRVDYARHFDERGTGFVDMTVNDDGGSQSGSDIEDRWEDDVESDNDDSDDTDESAYGSGDDTNSVADSNAGSDHEAVPTGHVPFDGGDGGEQGQRQQQWGNAASELFCTCRQPEDFEDLDNLRDNGESVTKAQWKMWELWTLGKRGCAIHDGAQSLAQRSENIP